MTAETLLAPIELIALERGRREGQQEGWQKGQQEGWQKGRREGALIGRVQTCQELLGLVVTPTEELVNEPMDALQEKCRTLEARLRSQLRRPS